MSLPHASTPPRMACRQMTVADAPGVAGLLARGFPARRASYWSRAIAALAARTVPEGCPRFGYVLTADHEVVGVVLLIFSTRAGQSEACCNVSSWYVDTAFRTYASWLISVAIKRRRAIYFNMSSAAHTRETVQAQGFSRYTGGTVLAAAFLMRGPADARVRVIEAGHRDERFPLLSDHASYGCISVIVRSEGREYPFVFLRRRVPHSPLPCAQLIYCRDIGDVRRFAGALGRHLLKRGLPIMMLDADGTDDGLLGVYLKGRSPKYGCGPVAPRRGDLAYCEAVLFGP